MTHRHVMNISQCMVYMALLLFLAATPAAAAMTADQGEEPEQNSMNALDTIEFQAIPPIDAAAPRRYQTASFGLG